MATGGEPTIEALTCSICLEIFLKPVTTSCGHTFCSSCIAPCLQLASPNCPLCREVFDPQKAKKNSSIDKQVNNTKGSCKGCGKKMSLAKMRSHNSSCSKLTKTMPKFSPVAPTSQPIPSNVPNRSTFMCPYCGLKNLDCSALVRHCNDAHRDDNKQVVCPICSSMPWGDPSFKSANFIGHLNVRHKFEYDTYVDFEADDDSMLEEAIRRSLSE
ncbi:PREDICTED: RING finger protein 166-like [Branchiostoma belcheri]|uniref:RING finger protein 166-like n=1 Tax=Branchiostoma belcheri TaxID=7741 RepID=A0A6P4ZF47_BRABE|nr:PREDICTED: RING finger protein 166-like [Branchiostoma belcheri]KAI8504471.1 hypothetical protein Bbelb_175890 [Branchiostoma belcheri]